MKLIDVVKHQFGHFLGCVVNTARHKVHHGGEVINNYCDVIECAIMVRQLRKGADKVNTNRFPRI